MANNRIEALKEELRTVESYIEFEIDGRTPKQFLTDYKNIVLDNDRLTSSNKTLEADLLELGEKWKKQEKKLLQKLQHT